MAHRKLDGEAAAGFVTRRTGARTCSCAGQARVCTVLCLHQLSSVAGRRHVQTEAKTDLIGVKVGVPLLWGRCGRTQILETTGFFCTEEGRTQDIQTKAKNVSCWHLVPLLNLGTTTTLYMLGDSNLGETTGFFCVEEVGPNSRVYSVPRCHLPA